MPIARFPIGEDQRNKSEHVRWGGGGGGLCAVNGCEVVQAEGPLYGEGARAGRGPQVDKFEQVTSSCYMGDPFL